MISCGLSWRRMSREVSKDGVSFLSNIQGVRDLQVEALEQGGARD